MRSLPRMTAAAVAITILTACSGTTDADIAPGEQTETTDEAAAPSDDPAESTDASADADQDVAPEGEAAEDTPEADDDSVAAAPDSDGTFPLFAANDDFEPGALKDHSFRAPLDAYDYEATAANADVAGECYAQMLVTDGGDINIEWQADTEASFGPNAFASQFNGMDGIGATYSLVTNDRRDDEPVPTYAKFEAQVVPNGDTAARVSIFLDPENPYVGDSYGVDDSGNYGGVTQLAFGRNVTGGVIDAELRRITQSGGDAYPETLQVKGYFTCDTD